MNTISKKTRNKLTLIAFATVLVIVLFYNIYPHGSKIRDILMSIKDNTTVEDIDLENDFSNSGQQKSNIDSLCDKWVVLQTNDLPNEHVKFMHDSCFSWCMVVVADAKTPTNWTYKDTIYLSIDDQAELSDEFKLINEIPFNSHLRKIIGYIYAIKNGAKYIYETNDQISTDDGLYGFRYEKFNGLYFSSPNLFIPDLNSTKYASKYRIYSSENIPYIQQSLETQNMDSNSPPFVLEDQYFPLNSNNTLYHYNSFWSLFFPFEFSLSYSELLRGLIATRLLQEISGNVALMPPNSNSKQNSQVYSDGIQELINNLKGWSCKSNSFQSCFIDLVTSLVDWKILLKEEIKLYKRWISILNYLGYKWPNIKRTNNKNKNDYFHSKLNTISAENSNNESMIFNKVCPNNHFVSNKAYKHNGTILILSITSKTGLDLDKAYFSNNFNYIVMCFNTDELQDISESFIEGFINQSSSSITVMLHKNNEFLSKCVRDSLLMGFKQLSFLIVPDKTKFDYWNFDYSQSSFEKYRPEIKNYDMEEGNVFLIRKSVSNGRAVLRVKNKLGNNLCSSIETDVHFKKFINLTDSLNWNTNDLASEYCENMQQRTIWIPDWHTSTRLDSATVLVQLGHIPIIGSHPSTLANPSHTKLLNKFNIKITNQYSEFISRQPENAHWTNNIREYLIRKNFEFYSISSDFSKVDAVSCAFPAASCEAFMPLNKTIILNPGHRYNIGRCSARYWLRFNHNLFKLKEKSKLITAAMGRYDIEYMEYYTGLRGYRLYTYASYLRDYRNLKYNPTRKEILIGPTTHLNGKGGELAKNLESFNKSFVFRWARTLYSHYSVEDLLAHRAVVILPYAVLTYSVTEFYTLKIPMFFPSIKLLTEWKLVDDRMIQFYCETRLYQEIEPCKAKKHLFSPNNNTDEPYKYWIKYADFFQWPFITYFDSWDDLIIKLETSNFKEISRNMERFNVIREADLLNNWCQVLKSITNGKIPKSYEESLKYFNVSSFQEP